MSRRVFVPGTAPHKVEALKEAVTIALQKHPTDFSIVDALPEPNEPLLVVMSNTYMLNAARELSQKHDVVIWAWNCPEEIAERALNYHPVVYGDLTPEMVEQAASAGVQPSTTTSLLARVEKVFNFNDQANPL